MQFMSSWATEDRKTLLNFSETTLNTFLMHLQTKYDDHEAGGILLGTVHGNNMLIEFATLPTVRDLRFRCLFERLPFGHAEVALANWLSSNGKIRYLGEWHTHPEDYPKPSELDRTEWRLLSEKRLDKRPLLAVIVGRKNLHVEMILSSGDGYLFKSVE